MSCTKTPPAEDPIIPPPPPENEHIIELGKASVLRNGVPWNANFTAYYHGTKSRFGIRGDLRISGFDHGFKIYDIKGIKGPQKIEGLSYLNTSNSVPNSLYSVVLDGDQLINSYTVDTTLTTHFIEILHFDSVANIVEGRFQTTLEGPNTWSFLPDTMKMTEGKFHLRIE
jgi:hypothetical protein